MNEKIKGFIIGTIIIISSLCIVSIPNKINVQADEEVILNKENSINSTYIFEVALDLSRIINQNSKGRWFGSDGENRSKEKIRDWMNESNLWTSTEQVSSEISQEFIKSNRLMKFSEDLQVNNMELIIYNSSNHSYLNIADFYIHPRWNASILEFLPSEYQYDENQLTNVFEEKNLEIKPRPLHISRILNFLFINHSSDLLANNEIMSGNTSALTNFLLEQFEIDNNVSFEDILANPENASLIPGFTEDTYSDRGDYVFIGEDMAFNPNYNHTYWDGWNEFFDYLINNTNDSFLPIIHNLAEKCRDQKQRIEMFIWSLCDSFKGLVLYDHNNDTYDMCYNSYFSRPTIYINRSVGLDIVHNLDDHYLNYTLDQEWNENVESYNVIGQLNTTETNNPNEYMLIGCLYDGWHNQASGDSAIGMGVLLAIAKYFKDYNIIPKTNIRFVAFSGEEAGGRGAFSYEKDHENDTIPLIIDLNQFGYSQNSPRQALWMFSNNAPENMTLHAISEDTDFVSRVDNTTDLRNLNVSGEPFFSDHTPFYLDGKPHTIISFLKENTSFPLFTWRMHHRDGLNHVEGDSMAYYNSEEVNATASLIFNVTRYYAINPDCWFDSINYQAFNSTGGTAPDSIKATFMVKSTLPSDKVLVCASLYNASTRQPVVNKYYELNLIVNRTGVERNVTFSMPSGINEGDYYIQLEVFNSTGRINRSLGYSYSSNDTEISPTFHLNKYLTMGDIRIGTTSTNCHNYVRGSKYIPSEDLLVHNITAYVYGNVTNLPVYQCMIYRWSDGQLIGSTGQLQKDSTGWIKFSFNPRPILRDNTQYVLSIWGDNDAYVYRTYHLPANGYNNHSYIFGVPPEDINWDMNVGCYQHSLFCHYGLDLYPPKITNILANPETAGFGYNVTISANVSDNGSGLNEVKIRISDPGGRQGNYTMTHVSGNLYRYIFTDSWLVGQYNYSI